MHCSLKVRHFRVGLGGKQAKKVTDKFARYLFCHLDKELKQITK